MAENIIQNDLESEIVELSRQIENKKRELEVENNIEREEKKIVAETIAEHFYKNPVSSIPSDNTNLSPLSVLVQPTNLDKDYLDTIPPELIETINGYISMVPKEGIRRTIKRVQAEQPFIIDAFHDALVTRLHEELKSRGIVK